VIITGCNVCIFAKRQNDKAGCVLNQLCVLKNDQMCAPGFCRLCRTQDWAQKQGTRDLEQLKEKVAGEMPLLFDMLVFFDERNNTIADLERTLWSGSKWYSKYARKVTIVDTTGFGKDRKNLALKYILSKKEHPVKTVVDSSVEHEPVCDRADTLKRISKDVQAPFFLAIPAGGVIANFDGFANMIDKLRSRVIYWSFPSFVGDTAIVTANPNHGLFITQTYRSLVNNSDGKSFSERLKEEEVTTEMDLHWFCSDCWLV